MNAAVARHLADAEAMRQRIAAADARAIARNRAIAEHEAAVREFTAAHRADGQARLEALIREVVAVLAEAIGEGACVTCIGCRRALSPRRVTCPHCGRDGRSAGWPVTRSEAAA